MISNKNTQKIWVGNVPVGGSSPISIQSMTKTYTANIKETVAQINLLEENGCQIIRLAVPDMESAKALSQIKTMVNLPIIADIHFDYKLALQSIKSKVDGLRLNPGNIGNVHKISEVVKACKEREIPIRIGVNAGSLSKEKLQKYGLNETAIVESALEHVAILEKLAYDKIKISVKSSDVNLTINSYKLLSEKVAYPLHLGLTEAGTKFTGTIKSSLAIGSLLSQNIGDTIRVSLTENPIDEVIVAKEILKFLNLRKGLNLISCPTCGRCRVNLIEMAKKVEKALIPYSNINISVAVMGCEVNGPGEAKEADYGIAGGNGEGLLFKKGKILKKVSEKILVDELVNLIKFDFKSNMENLDNVSK